MRYKAKLGYGEDFAVIHRSRTSAQSLPMNADATSFVDREIRSRIRVGRLFIASHSDHLVTSPVGAVPKPSVNGQRKWRMIHHLSYPGHSKIDNSVNRGIDSDAVTLKYFDLTTMLVELGSAIRKDPPNIRKRTLWKVHPKDAHRHMVVEHNDHRLLGFYWPEVGHVY
jgi:hypothetical protein